MQKNINYKRFSFILIFISIFSFIIGYSLDENSAGAGSYNGDIQNVWNNLQIFISNDLISSINNLDYHSSRTPLLYILHEIFNPFVDNLESYRGSVFAISLILPVLFYFCLKQKFKEEDTVLLILISSILFLSPYYRTSSYWGLEENYGLIFLLLSFLLLNSFLKNENETGYKTHISLFTLTIISSCCIYLDQKLIIIPIICFFKIIASNKFFKFKLLTTLYYFLLSLPYIYLIILWGGLIPGTVSEAKDLNNEIHLIHIGYSSTIIAFYLLPLLLFKEKKILHLLKNLFLYKINYYLVSLFIIYFIYLIGFYDFNEQSILGKGIIHKISLIAFGESFARMIFIYFSFFISWIIILAFTENEIFDISIIFYFFILSIFVWPIFQEFFDPVILLMVFVFFKNKLVMNYRNSTILYIYLSILLLGSNIYYANLFN